MKKALMAFLFLFGVAAVAFGADTLLEEGFEDAVPPSDWTLEDTHANTWFSD